MTIVLIGFMGSGKSTLAKYLSQTLAFTWIEMDNLVCQKANVPTIADVFAKGGEILLRETEIALAKEYSTHTNLVVSTGGGIVLNKIALDYFKQNNSKIFFLHASFNQIAKRLKTDLSRPLFKSAQEAQKLYNFRLPLYRHYADEVIDTDGKSVEAVALQVFKGSALKIPPKG